MRAVAAPRACEHMHRPAVNLPMCPDILTTAPSAERALLEQLAAGPVSGGLLARQYGQTRAAVWKRIQALRAAGVEIQALPGRGYLLAQPLELLDPAAIVQALGADAAAGLAALEVAWELDSTNTELLRRPVPARGVMALLAERQRAGRGRRGRAWASPLAANLYLSVSRGFSGGLARLGGLGLVAGVAVVDALHAAGLGAVRLKWPNDLVVPDSGGGAMRKLGGLLVEGAGEHAGPVRAVLGLGLNMAMPPAASAGIGQPWVDTAGLAAPGQAPGRNCLAGGVLAHLVPALEVFDRDGLAPFLARYAAHDVLAGQTVQVIGARDTVIGRALGLAPDGALRVQLQDGERHFHAGEVSVRAGGAS